MEYIELILEETEKGFDYREIKIPGERVKQKSKVSSCPGRFFLYYDASKKEEGKNFYMIQL